MSKFIRRITAIAVPVDRALGEPRVEQIYSAPKRKVSSRNKAAEKASRRVAQALRTLGDELLSRQERANKKRKDGWLKRGNVDVGRAQAKAMKRLLKP
ncbi:MAG: hypothetical protein U1E65_30835 [Myxococcota bacterium]